MRLSLRNLALVVTILGCTALVSGSANAAPTLVGTTTNPTGIDGLVVDGTIYNVTFSTTTLNTFTEGSTLSIDAAASLASALNSLSVTQLNNEGGLGFGFYTLDVDNSLSPFDFAGLCNSGCGLNPQWVTSTYTGFPISLGVVFFGQPNQYFEAADFTEVGTVAAPEPLTLSLVGAGLVGAAAMRRRKKKSA